MSIATDLLARAEELTIRRSGWEAEWRDIADYCLPTASRQMSLSGAGGRQNQYDRVVDIPAPRESARRRFDSTAMWAIDRLAAGVESLVIPQSEKWHALGLEDAFSPEPSEAETAWLERVRDYQFKARYDAKSGFAVAAQKAFRSAIAFGTGVMFVEEAWGGRGKDQRELPIAYSYVPLSEVFLSMSAQGFVDTLYRRTSMSARQMVQRFGDKVSEKVKRAADDPAKCETKFPVLHAVQPRDEYGSANSSARRAPIASYYLEEDGTHLLGESGFYEFPFPIFYWIQSDDNAYGESPVMLCIDDIRGLNVMKKTSLRAMQMHVDPPLAIAHDGVMNRPNLNPRALNFNAIDPTTGRLKIQPIITSQDPRVVEGLLEQERGSVRETLYLNLFQILLNNPNMTATEAMLRANEKGELLGPAGAKLQQGLAFMVERELGILTRKDAFAPGAALEAPQSLQGKNYGVRFTSPLDRLRRMSEAIGVERTLELAANFAPLNPSIMDSFDFDYIMEHRREVMGAPKRIMRPQEAVAQDRQAKAQQQQAAAAAELVQRGGDAAGSVANAGKSAAEMGAMMAKGGNGLSPDMLQQMLAQVQGG